ncbi:MAG: hypothetical protein ACI9LN_001151, partial [Saprospiraceae bacterium]
LIVSDSIWMSFEFVQGKKRRHSLCYGEYF